MKKPPFTKVKVLGVEFDVEFIEQKKLSELAGDQWVFGLTDGADDKIYVAKELKHHCLKRIFIHEWAHAVPEVNGVNQTIDPAIAEVFSHSFANALLELLEQPEILKFLLSKK